MTSKISLQYSFVELQQLPRRRVAHVATYDIEQKLSSNTFRDTETTENITKLNIGRKYTKTITSSNRMLQT
jgi:hypothetical protein